MRTRHLVAALLAATFTVTVTPAVARPDCSKACVERVKARERAEIKRRHARALAREMRYYRAHPMPWCTWGPESSGPPYTVPEWSLQRYRINNPTSTASGKFQMLDGTFHAYGGEDFYGSHDASKALPVIQERVARRVLIRGWHGTPPQGLGAWSNC